MKNIIYYYIPKEYLIYKLDEINEKKLVEKLDTEGWSAVTVTDSEECYAKAGISSILSFTPFADRIEDVSSFLWSIKANQEEMKIFYEENSSILEQNQVEDVYSFLNFLEFPRRKEIFIAYMEKNYLNKIVKISSEETILIVVRNYFSSDLEKNLEIMACKGDFYKYELGAE